MEEADFLLNLVLKIQELTERVNDLEDTVARLAMDSFG